ncbi:MAG: hypothetical protein AAGB24_15085 [Bacteroidota bacterium]
MKKNIIFIVSLLLTGFAFSQTTVTLQDQCNCEVLSGTDVTAPGTTSPTGADIGDIYVNTNTGTIFFWDGDSWELTSSDDQQLTGFTLDGVTNTLTLDLENSTSVSVDLSSLSDTFSDTNTTIASFGIDGTNTNLVITDSDANSFSVALVDIAALIDTDDQDISTDGSSGNISIDDGSTLTLNVDDADAVIGNEYNTGFTVTGGNLRITDGGGDLDVPLASIDTDDQDATEVNLNSAVDVDGDGNDETTVQQAIEDIAAILAVPTIYATGKVAIEYVGTPGVDATNSNLFGADVTRIDEGDYQVDFDTALSNASYIIQLVTLDCGGDCPGNSGANYDDPGITYYDQQTSGFKVNIGDSDNGSIQKDDIDLEFMFTVITIPN